MPRPNITMLTLPPRRYRLSAKVDGFETLAEAKAEDRKRARLLRKDAAKTKSGWGAMAAALADRIDPDLSSHVPVTLASNRYKRRHRRRTVGHVAWVASRRRDGRICNFTVIRKDWTRHTDTLDGTNLERILRQFREDLDRAKATFKRKLLQRGKPAHKPWDGWIWAEIHGEHEPETDSFPIHVHGVATGDMIEVLDCLRRQRVYKRWAADGDIPPAKRPVVLSRKRFFNLLSGIAYNSKSYWPSKRLGLVKSGAVKKQRFHSRIQNPQHSHVLLFLDQWTLPQITLLYGLTIRNGRLVKS